MGAQSDTSTSAPEVWHGVQQILAQASVAAHLATYLGKFGLALEPTKTKLVEFGRFAQRHASKHGRKRPETIYFLGFTLYCARNRKGNFKVGMRTESGFLTLIDDQWSTANLLGSPNPYGSLNATGKVGRKTDCFCGDHPR